MKKTKRIIGVTALLLAALMLFSSCAITYRKADAADYVKLTDGFDFKNFKLNAEIEKMVVTDDDVKAYINKELLKLRTAAKDGAGNLVVNQPGAYEQYDVLTIRTVLYNKDGDIVKNDFLLGNKANPVDDGTIVLGSEQALSLGYGIGVHTGLLDQLEKDIFSDPKEDYVAQNQWVMYNNVGSVAAGALDTVPVVGYVTYGARYYKGETPHEVAAGDTPVPMHFYKLGADIEKNGVGDNSYEEILYLGLKALIEAQTEDEKKINPSFTKELKISVYPEIDGVPDDAVFDESNVAIAYNMDFEDTTKHEYKTGVVTVKLWGAVAFADDSEDTAPFVTTYTYPDDSKETYEKVVNGETKKIDLAGSECTVYTYVIERAKYTRPEYNAATIKNEFNFVTDKTDDAAVIAEYEASLKARFQKACDALAEEQVKQALLAQILANTSLIKEPTRNIKNYVKSTLAAAKEQYHGGGYRDKTNANGDFLYDDFEDFVLTALYGQQTNANGESYTSLDQIKDALYAEGRELVKENLLIYYLADQLGCRLDNDQLVAMAKERGAVWAKEQIEAGRKYITDSNTVAQLQANYPDTLASTGATETAKQQLFRTWGATSYQDCLDKMLAYYGEMYGETFATWEDYAKAAYPDDAYDWKDYVEAKQGKENLYGIYHAEVVMAKLLELNATNVAASYKEIPFDSTKIELK